MTPLYTEKDEDQTRKEIDQKLISAGWVIQDKKRINLFESLGVAVRDKFAGQQIWTAKGCPEGKSTGMCFYQMDTSTGPADYMLFIDAKACGIIEAKREGEDLGHVAEQSARYSVSPSNCIERWVPEDQPLPFLYEATNHEIRFRDERDPCPRSRNVFHFHKPETFKEWLEEETTLRQRFHNIPELTEQGNKIEAGTAVEIRDRLSKQKCLEAETYLQVSTFITILV